MNKKKNNEQRHFRRRCEERLGHKLVESDIIGFIRGNKLEFLGRTSNRVTCWKYTEDDSDYAIVYDKSRHTLVTIYPV